jgi:flagellar basal-body rod protein FlgG
MSDTVSLIAATMRADADALRTVAQNIANAESVAYRRRVPVAHASFEALAAMAPANLVANAPANTAVNALADAAADAPANAVVNTPANAAKTLANAVAIESQTIVDMQPGTLRQTGQPLHVAIEGAGFLVISTPQGDALTRGGDLRVAADGALTTAAGHPVFGEQGPLVIGDGTPTIDADGTVRVNGASAGRLRIVEASDPARLEALGDGAFAAPAGVELVETGAARVRQGFLETSNVSAVGEMIRMMEVMRHFEAAQRLARTHDDMLGKAISQLGRV